MVSLPPKTRPRIFLVDGYALVYRAFFAFISRPLMNARGENTSAPFGFAHFLLDILDNHAPDYLAVVFDAGTSQREELYPEYKATREKMPDELAASLPRIRELVDALHAPVISLDGFEADDVIATLAKKAEAQGLEAVIVSGDKDFYQLIREGVSLLNPGRGGPSGVEADWVDTSNAHERFGVQPDQIIDYLALVGDASDNVPGAPGVGPKTAVKLLDEYGTAEEALKQASEISGKRVRESLTENADMVRLSRTLVTMIDDLDVPLDLDAYRVGEPDRERLRELFIVLEFRTLLERFTTEAVEAGTVTGLEGVEYRLVTDAARVDELVVEIRESGWVSVDTETTDIDPNRAEVVGVSLALDSGCGYYLPFGHRTRNTGTLLEDTDDGPVVNLPPLASQRMRGLVEVLEDPEIRKIGQNLKYDAIVLRRAGIELGGIWFDTMIASYVLDPSRRQHSLDALAMEVLGHSTTKYSDVAGKGKAQIPFAEVPLDVATDYAGEDAVCALRLKESFEPEMQSQDLSGLFHDLEMPLIPVLIDMEYVGIRIDTALFQSMSTRLAGELRRLEAGIQELAGEEFNVNSTPQLRKILFEKLELPVIKKTKTGPSTDASVLEELASQGHELPVQLLEYRQLEKLRGTYVDALPRLLNPKTGRLHTSFNQTVAATGRLSSSDPNLQNIPIRTEVGREIRKGFIPADGMTFFGADYSQIELRILAHFSGDEAFVRAFREGKDVHRETASVIFEVPADEVTSEMRSQAKTINFATLYGQGAFSLASQIGVSREEAQAFIDSYFERFAGVRGFLDDQVAQAHERGWVATLAGRRRYVPELKNKNWNVRQFGERIAQNTPIQGTAADMIKIAMIRIHDRLAKGDTGARLLLQVHDELLFEVPEDRLDEVRELVVEEMEGAMSLDVPLVADWGIGESWYESKG